MERAHIRYRSGYKYQLVAEYTVKLGMMPGEIIRIEFIELATSGDLVIKRGYAWDGASGPAPDTRKLMRGSLVHDALYQLMRREPIKFPAERWRDEADLELQRICRQGGMSRFWAWVVYQGVHKFGEPATTPEARKKKHTAP